MSILQTIVLALIQGLTEFLPVSSSAHLILPSKLLGWPDQGLAFDVAVHVGTLLAVIIYFRKDIAQMIRSAWSSARAMTMPKDEAGCMFWYIMFATIPVGIVGLLCKGLIEQYLRSELVIAFSTIIFGIVLWHAQFFNKKNVSDISKESTGTTKLTLKKALIIGCAQAVALIPGTSRSGITLTVGYYLKLSPTTAAKFSFLLSIPVIILSGLLSLKGVIENGDTVPYSDVAIGVVVSFVTACIVIKLFLDMLGKLGLLPYVIYRIFLGIFLLWILL